MKSARLIGAYIETAFLRKEYKEKKKAAVEADRIISIAIKEPMVGPYIDHPAFQTRAKEFANDILQYSGPKADLAINYGDSIVDMWHERWKSIDIPMSVGGFHHHHMLQMAKTMKPFLDQKKLQPKYIMIGTLGGNPLLQHQEINSVVAKSIECLNGLRAMYPANYTRLIVYGLPPVIAMYATACSFKFEAEILKWVVNDDNAVFLPMFKSFAGTWGIMPKTYVSAEGVHLSPVGQVLLDERFEVAKTARPKSMVDYC
jgi:hypothetical protein